MGTDKCCLGKLVELEFFSVKSPPLEEA